MEKSVATKFADICALRFVHCRLVSYCSKHCQPKPHMAGVRLISKEEESKQKVRGDDGNGLWNAQLFPPPALVPVPDCPSGCSRMEPLEVS